MYRDSEKIIKQQDADHCAENAVFIAGCKRADQKDSDQKHHKNVFLHDPRLIQEQTYKS